MSYSEEPEPFTELSEMHPLRCNFLWCDSHLPLILFYQLKILKFLYDKTYVCGKSKSIPLVNLTQSNI